MNSCHVVSFRAVKALDDIKGQPFHFSVQWQIKVTNSAYIIVGVFIVLYESFTNDRFAKITVPFPLYGYLIF